VDDVTIGSGLPDLWVKAGNKANGVPGATIQQTLVYGNQGSFPAQGVTLSVTLPDKLTFVSADPAPTSVNGQILSWDAGDLAGKSGPFTIQITATVAPDAELLSALNLSAAIQTTSNELETANNTAETQVIVEARMYLPGNYR
jgi:uncharacterized repeat protein (TIGR01451 family)